MFTGNYGEAGALEWYDVGAPVYSGHNGWARLGPAARRTSGRWWWSAWTSPTAQFTGCREVARLTSDVEIDNDEQGRPVFVCDGPIGSWSERWDELSHYDA